MPQNTNLNRSPYFDDFDAGKNFYRILFRPGYSIQARELTQLQSMLQDQVEQVGNSMFKQGQMVIPGEVSYSDTYDYVKLSSVSPVAQNVDGEINFVKYNISQLVGGAGEETILARVGEGIVSSIGSSKSHKEVLENPDRISKLVLERGLDAGTAYEILSIDIADIDIGKNIGAILQTDQAEADLKVAEAKAEERRAMAVAAEQEMIAKAQEARAKVILAEAEVPKAMAEAFRQGNLGIMDYYKFQNIQADTGMRESIADDKSKESGGKTDKGSKSE